MLIKWCLQFVNKFRKLSSGHETGKGEFLFQSQRRAVPKNVQTILQLCSFYILARLWSKSFKLGFSSSWTENFQMYKLDLENVQETEIKLPAFIGSWRKQGHSRKTSTSASLITLSFWLCGSHKLRKIHTEMGVPDHLPSLLRNLYAGQETMVRTRQWTSDWLQIGKEYIKAVYCHLAYWTYMQSSVQLLSRVQLLVHHVKCWAGRITS